jgi:hypothetical protein
MNKLILLIACLFCLSSVYAQHKTGVNISGGVGYGDIFSRTDYQIGVPVSLTIKDNIKFLTGFEFSQKNNLNQTLKEKSYTSEPFCIILCSTHFKHDVKQFSYTYLQVPLLTKMEFRRLTFQMGIVPSFGLGGQVSRYERERWSALFGDNRADFTDSAIERRLDYKVDNIRRFDLAGRLGFGFHFYKFELGMVFNRSLRDLNLDSQFKPLHNTSLMVSLDYFFLEKQ